MGRLTGTHAAFLLTQGHVQGPVQGISRCPHVPAPPPTGCGQDPHPALRGRPNGIRIAIRPQCRVPDRPAWAGFVSLCPPSGGRYGGTGRSLPPAHRQTFRPRRRAGSAGGPGGPALCPRPPQGYPIHGHHTTSPHPLLPQERQGGNLVGLGGDSLQRGKGRHSGYALTLMQLS